MDLIIALPDHVAAAWPDPESAAAWLVAQATAEHDRQVMDTAREQANHILAEAAATIGGAEPPAVPTTAERVAAVEVRVDRFAGLAADLVALVGGDEARAAAEVLVSETVAPPPLIDAYTESR